MKRFIKYPSIGQFRAIVKDVKHSAMFKGMDDDGNPIMDRVVQMPKITATGTEKIHGCFHKLSMITLANGEQRPISEIDAGTYVLSYNHNTKQNEVKPVINVMQNKLSKEWCKLIFDKTEIICTKDHKIWTENRGYVEAINLSTEDVFKQPN